MRRQRYITIVAIGAVLAASAATAEAKSVYVRMGLSVGRRIAWPIVPMPVIVRPVIVPPPPVRTVVIASPLRCRFVPIGYCYPTVVVRPPVARTVVVAPAPVVTTKTVAVESAVVTVWVRNSNGSQSPVELTRSGPGYIGPRGEYYPEMPDNEQLRTVYGF